MRSSDTLPARFRALVPTLCVGTPPAALRVAPGNAAVAFRRFACLLAI
jgi:hypothetical protein